MKSILTSLAVTAIAISMAACSQDSRYNDGYMWERAAPSDPPDINSGDSKYLNDATGPSQNQTGTNHGDPNNLTSPSPTIPGSDGNFNSGLNPNSIR